MKKIIPIILAGGSGSRLWPLSRQSFPKQFLSLNFTRNKSLLQNTYLRISRLNNIDDPILICNEDHRFLDGEEVIYTAGGTPIGVGATNIGFTTSLLSNGGTYFISHFTGDTKAFKIHISEENALAGINTIDFLAFGNNTHTFTAKKDRRRVAKIAVVNSGHGYQNNKVVVSSTKYPPEKQEDIFKTFVGVSTYDNCIYAKNHNFKNGDKVKIIECKPYSKTKKFQVMEDSK